MGNLQTFFEDKCGGQKHTIGDFIRAVMKIDNSDDARKFYLGGIEWHQWYRKQSDSEFDDSPENVMRSNIGWCFGEGMSPEYIKMWNEVTGASHPIFGTSMLSPEEAFEMGKKWAEQKKK